MWELPTLFAPPSRIDRYQRYRIISDTLHSKIATCPNFEKFIHTAAIHLGYRYVKNEIVIESQAELAVVLDYAQNEIIERGKCLLEIYRDSTNRHSREESELLEAWIESEAGLYRLVGADPDEALVTAEDLTDPGHQITLTDFGLSTSYEHNKANHPNAVPVVFFRPTQLTDFAMSCSFFCGFRPAEERELLKLWHKYDGSTRFASIARLFKTKGVTTIMSSEIDPEMSF